ncbi:hypothetical protein ACLKA6_010906 [Drosophila palustris]
MGLGPEVVAWAIKTLRPGATTMANASELEDEEKLCQGAASRSKKDHAMPWLWLWLIDGANHAITGQPSSQAAKQPNCQPTRVKSAGSSARQSSSKCNRVLVQWLLLVCKRNWLRCKYGKKGKEEEETKKSPVT